MPPFNIPEKWSYKGKEWEIWEKVDGKFLRACVAELMAMHLFVLLCCGCAMVTLALPNPNLMMVAASFGFGILVLAQIFGPLSGGHINCAVSAGLFVSGRCSLLKAVCYTLSQMVGSIFGALFLWAIFGNNWPAARAFGSNSWNPLVFSSGQVFFAEMLGTSMLMLNVLSTIDIPVEGGGPLGVYPIAMSVMISHLFLLPIDGCSINPTRSFGPFIVANWAKIPMIGVNNQQWCFWFGPLFGSILSALIYEFGTLKPENFAGAKDMDKSIFGADKKKRAVKGRRASAQTLDRTADSDHSLGDVVGVGGAAIPVSGAVDNPLNKPNKSKNDYHAVQSSSSSSNSSNVTYSTSHYQQPTSDPERPQGEPLQFDVDLNDENA